jgi:hypothetical protein
MGQLPLANLGLMIGKNTPRRSTASGGGGRYAQVLSQAGSPCALLDLSIAGERHVFSLVNLAATNHLDVPHLAKDRVVNPSEWE